MEAKRYTNSEKPVARCHILNDSIDMKCPREAERQRQKQTGECQKTGRGDGVSSRVPASDAQFRSSMTKCPNLNGADGCTSL